MGKLGACEKFHKQKDGIFDGGESKKRPVRGAHQPCIQEILPAVCVFASCDAMEK
jgi:hypothetical protein